MVMKTKMRRVSEQQLLELLSADCLGGTIDIKPKHDRTTSPIDMQFIATMLLKPSATVVVRTARDILGVLDEFRSKRQEYMVCLSVGSGDRLIAKRVVTIGTLTSALAHPREIFADPLADRAAYIIIAHNHPSGDAQPSNKDISLTQQLVAASQILGVPLHDHFIITAKSYFSFREVRLLL